MKTIDLKAFRKINNLTQLEVAEFLGVQKAFVSAVECGRSKLPKEKLTLLLDNPHGWDISMLPQSSYGDNTIQVSGNNVDMRNINQSKGVDDAKRVKDLETRIEELIKDKERLQDMVDKMQAQISKLLEKI